MSKLSFTKRGRRVLSLVLLIAAATFVVLGLSARTPSADQQLVEICHKGNTISVDVHAVPAHLEHGDSPVPCDAELCGCGLNFDPVGPCADGKVYANRCLAACAGHPECTTRLGVCSNIFDPVICNGQLYASECVARNAGCDGPFTQPCPCGTDYNPVRCDGTIYANPCAATCAGATGCTPLN